MMYTFVELFRHRVGCDTRSIFKRDTTGLNSQFSSSLSYKSLNNTVSPTI